MALGLDMLSTYDPNFSEAYVRNIQQVTAEDIREVARLYFPRGDPGTGGRAP